jgi:AraC-like DNA-binding protein
MPDTTKTYLLTFFLANLQKMVVELLGATTVENATAPRVEINRHLKLDQEKWFGEGLPPAEIDFNSEKTRVIFSREIAEMELPSANAFASQSATDVCELHLQQLLNEEDIVAKILLMLEETDGDFPSMESIAKELCLSPRTLHRHLKARNCNFRQIVSTVKMERARKLLIKDELSITEIAFQLGYTDAANFSNAFKRAHGLAPSQIKNQIKSQLKDHVRQIQYV